MRVLVGFFLVFLIGSAVAPAADLKITVVDPRSAVVSGAQILLIHAHRSKVLSAAVTSFEGSVTIHTDDQGPYQIKILAPGFAPETAEITSQSELTVRLGVATAAETVVVTATRTPVAGEAAGADVDTLNGSQLTTMQPVSANDAVRFLPGAVVNTAGQRGGLASLFVRGGESNYNKVIVDGVTVNEPGGTFDFGTLPLTQVDRMEFVRGAQSTLYGSDAMTSVVQVWTRNGNTPVPELRFGADGGNFLTSNGYAALAGARGRFDYNWFGSQFNTNGNGINDAYSDSLEGANAGAELSHSVSLRVRIRHSNSHTGLPGEWDFNGAALLPPDPREWSQLNDLLGDVELSVAAPGAWQHRFSGFDYLYRYNELNLTGDPARIFDSPSHEVDHINRGGFEYQGDYSERTWTHSTFGYRVEDENGFVGDLDFPPQTHGQRINNEVYWQQQLTMGRLSVIGGGRFVHDSAFGNTGVPRVALMFQALGGGEILSGTRLRFAYATGFKEPRLEETFAGPPYSLPNTSLKPERLRAFETGFEQDFLRRRISLNTTYFNNLFHDQINYVTVNPVTFVGEYVNVNKAFAHGAEVVWRAQIRSRIALNSAYTYTSSEYLDNPAPFDPVYNPGQPLLRRPKHSASLLLTYLGSRWGANLGGSFVGRRADSDFLGLGINHAAGYVRADFGGWFALNSRVTAYANVENAFDRRYNEVVGYPGLPLNFRAGMRFRVGGE
jgi:vitamin B12 transporter